MIPVGDMFVSLFRAYRIGQCRDVTVLRLISLGTIEEIIYLRQVYKQVPDNYNHMITMNNFCTLSTWYTVLNSYCSIFVCGDYGRQMIYLGKVY